MSLSTGCVLDVDAAAIESGTSRDRNHHTLTPTDTTTVRGKAGKGTFFNGTTSFVDCGNDSSLNITNAITVEAWVKPTLSASIMYLFMSYSESSEYKNGFDIEASNKLEYDNYPPSGGAVVSDGTLNTEQWAHVAFTKSGTSLIFYINGIESGIRTCDEFTGTGITRHYVGFRRAVTNTSYFNGTIDSVKIYNYALSATQIKRHYLEKAYLHVPHPVRIP